MKKKLNTTLNFGGYFFHFVRRFVQLGRLALASLSTFVSTLRLKRSLVTTFSCCLSRDLPLFEVQEVSQKSPRKERPWWKMEREVVACLPRQEDKRVKSINKMKWMNERVGLSRDHWPRGNGTPRLPTCSFPVFTFLSRTICKEKGIYTDIYSSYCSWSWIFSRHSYLPVTVIPPSVGRMRIASARGLPPPSPTGHWLLISSLSGNQPRA